jgi:ketosteroid isomerase-like protein
MINTRIAELFSKGEFESTLDFIANDAVWEVVGENNFIGKQAIIENYLQVEAYFKTVTTNFQVQHVIADEKMVVINGTAEFLRDGQRVSFVSACDLYEFSADNLIQKITSYCIQK